MKAWTTVACFLLGMAAVAGAYSAGRAHGRPLPPGAVVVG
jgi:hypothetical protein